MELMVRRRWVVHQKEIILVTVLRLVNPCSGQSYNFRPERVYLPISVVDYTIFSFFFFLINIVLLLFMEQTNSTDELLQVYVVNL